MLVPPAPSAFSNSDLVIWPLPSASIYENRSFSASERLVGVALVEAVVCDWPCASSSALMVSGEICVELLLPVPVAVLPEVDVEVLVEAENSPVD